MTGALGIADIALMFQSTPGGDPPGDFFTGDVWHLSVSFQSTPGGDPPGDISMQLVWAVLREFQSTPGGDPPGDDVTERIRQYDTAVSIHTRW